MLVIVVAAFVGERICPLEHAQVVQLRHTAKSRLQSYNMMGDPGDRLD
jgi:hypothetical protein